MSIEDQMVALIREMIWLRKVHFKRVMSAFELCVAGSPDAPSGPSEENARLYAAWEGAKARLLALAESAPSSAIADAVRAFGHCHRPGRVVAVGFRLDDPPDVIAKAQAVHQAYMLESSAM